MHFLAVNNVPMLLLMWLAIKTAAGYQSTSFSNGQLNVISLTSHYLEGEFYNERAGIYFKSASEKGSNNYIAIGTHAGKNIFSSVLIDKDTVLVSVMDRDYLLTNTQLTASREKSPSVTGGQYLVPKSRRNVVTKALKSGLPLKYLTQSRYLDARGVQKAISKDLQALLMSEEGRLIQQTAMELGRRGLYGTHSTGCMAFYILAMRLADMQSQVQKSSKDCETLSNADMKMLEGKKTSLVTAKDIDLCMNLKGGQQECEGGGVCGVGCDCWKMVCGDCCSHSSCSKCGCKLGHISFSCFNLFGLKCDSC